MLLMRGHTRAGLTMMPMTGVLYILPASSQSPRPEELTCVGVLKIMGMRSDRRYVQALQLPVRSASGKLQSVIALSLASSTKSSTSRSLATSAIVMV